MNVIAILVGLGIIIAAVLVMRQHSRCCWRRSWRCKRRSWRCKRRNRWN